MGRGRARAAGFLLVLLVAGSGAAGTVLLRSGNGAPGAPDGELRQTSGPAGVPLSAAPFTAADFDAACAGAAPPVVVPHPAWLPLLPADPLAQWVAVDSALTPAAVLYCHEFDLAADPICSGSIEISYACDDTLGDLTAGGPNPAGVYLNDTPLTAFAGGDYTQQYQFSDTQVGALLRPGRNRLHVYQRDVALVVAGTLYSVTVTTDTPPRADAGADRDACAGETVRLDGSASSHPDCPAGLEYRWSLGGSPLGPWSSLPTLDVTAAASGGYDLEARCASAPACTAGDRVDLRVYPLPAVDAGPDQVGCEGRDYDLDAGAVHLPPCDPLEYRWLDGARVVRDWSPLAGLRVNVLVDTTFTVEARCAARPSCTASDGVTVDVRECPPLAVTYQEIDAARDATGVTVGWTTVEELDTVGFEVWSRGGPDGAANRCGWIDAAGPGHPYRFRHPAAPAGDAWYQVVEHTSDGPGDASGWVRARAAADAGGAAGRGRARRRP